MLSKKPILYISNEPINKRWVQIERFCKDNNKKVTSLRVQIVFDGIKKYKHRFYKRKKRGSYYVNIFNFYKPFPTSIIFNLEFTSALYYKMLEKYENISSKEKFDYLLLHIAKYILFKNDSNNIEILKYNLIPYLTNRFNSNYLYSSAFQEYALISSLYYLKAYFKNKVKLPDKIYNQFF
jgi:hypothetical protein